MKTTWYTNSVYGMDLLYGPYQKTEKVTWSKNQGEESKEDVEKVTPFEFYKKLVSATCEKDDGGCFGVLLAYARKSNEITCETILSEEQMQMKEVKEACKEEFKILTVGYTDSDRHFIQKVDTLKYFFEYFKEKKRMNVQKGHNDL